MLKIAFIQQPIGTIGFPVEGSLNIWIYEVARRLGRNYQVAVFARQGRDQEPREVREGVEYRRNKVIGDNQIVKILDRASRLQDPRRPLFASSIYYPGWLRKTARELGKEPWDIVHILNFSQLVPHIRRACPKAKIVLHMQCEWLSQLDRSMIERRLQKANLILGCSEYITSKIRSTFPRFAQRCHTVWNGVDPAQFVPRDSGKARTSQEPERLLWVGRISPEKGLHLLIDALPLVRRRFPRVQLDILGGAGQAPRQYIVDLDNDEEVRRLTCFYGGTEYYSHLQAQVRALGLESCVHFHVNRPYADLVPHYQKADICVFPSLSEAFGMPLIEAMACGLPVVAARTGGMTEIVVDGRTGLVVGRGSSQALAEALMHILSDGSLARSMGEEGRKRALECFSWDQVANSLRTRYEAIGETAPDSSSLSGMVNNIQRPGKVEPDEDFHHRPAL